MMKKYVLFLAIGLTLSGNVYAVTSEDFEGDLNTIQKSYSIIKDLRNEPDFKESAATFLKKYPLESSADILDRCIKANITKYTHYGPHPFYSNLVEEIDPLYRDLNPNCGTNGNGFPVKGIFSHS